MKISLFSVKWLLTSDLMNISLYLPVNYAANDSNVVLQGLISYCMVIVSLTFMLVFENIL